MRRLGRFILGVKQFVKNIIEGEEGRQCSAGAATWGGPDEDGNPIPRMDYDFWYVGGLIADIKASFWRNIGQCQHPAKHWNDESWAGPDSGGMGGSCTRCGFSFSHTLY